MPRVAVLDFGTLEIALDALIPGDGDGKWVTLGVPGYLIETDKGERILVDSGMPHEYIDDPVGTAKADDRDWWVRSLATAENLPAAQLAKLGFTPEDITHVIVTHTHFDHAGGLNDFPNAIHVIQRAERDLPTPLYHRFAWPENVSWQIVDGDTELLPGIRLLFTPGHAPGHQSVLVDMPKRAPVLLAIDAIYMPVVLESDNFKASWNEEKARESGRRVAALAEEIGAQLMYGHDPNQWAAAPKAPDWLA